MLQGNKKAALWAAFWQYPSGNYLRLLTASLNALPAENFAVFDAAILIASPVFGLRPVRAERLP
jgi:hypothetical protein